MAPYLVDSSILADVQSIDSESPYHYRPIQYVTIIMVSLFAISTIVHIFQAIRYRLWWMLPTACLCGAAEIAGWSARLWSSISPLLNNPFTIQITTTIIAPTPLVAANFIILGRLITRLGPQYSRLSPRWYSIVFCTCDIIALVAQGLGGGMASAADTNAEAQTGSHIMLGGIILQLVAIMVYAALGAEFMIRYTKNKPLRAPATTYTASGQPTSEREEMTTRLRIICYALAFSTTCLFIRAVYRTIELGDGWNGRIVSTQVYFNVLDGAMVILAIYTLNFAHPGFLLQEPKATMFNKFSDGSSDSETQMGFIRPAQ